MDSVTDLVRAAQGGDREAFEELVRATFLDTHTLARRLTANEEDALDVVQDTYLRAWRSIGTFRGDAQFSTWLYRITANCASTHMKRRRRVRWTPLESIAEPAAVVDNESPAEAAESAAELDRIAAALETLPPNLKGIVVLKDVYGLSHEAIAAELGISVANAKVRLHRARRKLQERLDGAGDGRFRRAV